MWVAVPPRDEPELSRASTCMTWGKSLPAEVTKPLGQNGTRSEIRHGMEFAPKK
jgi:hypothetical protein